MVGVGAVIIKDNQILLVKRANEPNKGYWSVPGGVVRLGEGLEEALKREVEEETGLEIEVGDVACVSEEIFRNGDIKYHYIIIDFFAEIISGKLRAGSDAKEARWISLNKLNEIKTVDFIQKLIEGLKSSKKMIYLK